MFSDSAEKSGVCHQFRSLFSAGAETDLRIMIPMVASVDELRSCRRLLPAAAGEAAFLSIGLGCDILSMAPAALSLP
ncbi:putative PEP-binding protein [Streptomyces sp. 8N616]|uniref:putative PEP-binding protein n=1 Tax=Streptomyces sp. 8N616 TaxID=3457414 RepID=UPI003FD16793